MAPLFRDLGWPETAASDENHRTFPCTNGVAEGFRAFALAVNLASFAECRQVYETLRHVDGVELLEEPTGAFWGGGFSWRDPEGNIWDVAWAKGTTFDNRGGVTFP